MDTNHINIHNTIGVGLAGIQTQVLNVQSYYKRNRDFQRYQNR
jgi:hypothetical protein